MSGQGDAIRSLDGFSIFGLIVVILAMVPVLFPIQVKLGTSLTRALKGIAIRCRIIGPPSKSPVDALSSQSSAPIAESNWAVPLNLTTSPPLAVLILLATTTINGSVIRTGIVGDGDSKPYDVLVLFISLAYIATALDSTGALRSLAFWVSNHTSGSGPQLYFVLYCFFFTFGVIFGNDPIILSGTAFLTYFLKHCGITNPTAWVFMEFVASNIASAVLVSSNPTNVLLAQAFDLNFLTGFTKFTIIPSVVSAIVGYILLYATFKFLTCSETHSNSSPPPEVPKELENDQSSSLRKITTAAFQIKKAPGLLKSLLQSIPRANYIPDRLNQPIVEPRSVLIDPQGAFFHGILMVTTLALLVGTTFIKSVSVWQVTMPAGVLALIRDVMCDIRSHNRKSLKSDEHELGQINNQSQAAGASVAESKSNQDHLENEMLRRPSDTHDPIAQVQLPPAIHVVNNQAQSWIQRGPENDGSVDIHVTREASDHWNLGKLARFLAHRFPCTTQTIKHLPLPLLPFAMAMFILISSLGHLGWVTVFARWLASLCSTPARTVYLIGFLGTMVLCPFVGTNIGATILMVNVISDKHFRLDPKIVEDPRIMRSAIFAIAMSSNIGAFSLTIPSSLAGLLWHQILKQKNISIRNREFLGWNLLPVIVLTVVSLSLVLLEVLYIF